MDAEARPERRGTTGPARDYRPIRDYAVVGDCHGAALVAGDGGVDWATLGRFDTEPVAWRLLDRRHGGFLDVRPTADHRVTRAYEAGTNVLETRFDTGTGTLVVRDFMPVGRRRGASTHDYVDLEAPHWLVRRIEAEDGAVPIDLVWRPSIGMDTPTPPPSPGEGRAETTDGCSLYAPMTLTAGGDGLVRGETTVEPGRPFHVVLTPAPLDHPPGPDRLDRMLGITRAFWREWIAYCRYRGPWREQVERSALALKLMTYAPSGAIVAAITTSLPEEIGGNRNWDYRYCWLRDATMTLHALSALGYSGEAMRFAGFLVEACERSFPEVRIMYGIDGRADLEEREIADVEGWQGSRPVRVGNGAYRQRQIDVYGELIDWASLYEALGGRLDTRARRLIQGCGEHVAETWDEPDHGLWEMRGPPRHHVHGKVMSWIALDRAMRLLGPREDWAAARNRIREQIETEGVHPEGFYRLCYGNDGTDAALLQIPLLDYPAPRDRFEATVAEIERRLKRGAFVDRYDADDGLEGGEGAFLICSFWYVDALLALGRHDEARGIFEELVAAANDVGLYAEEIDPESRAFLGNMPQAFTHLALVGSAIHLELCERGGPEALAGGFAERARRTVGATFGPRAIWAAIRTSGRLARLRSSRRSMMPRELLE